ncbi:histidinol dehydrogenase [Bradyrhizobium sp. LM3.4]
MAPRRSRRSQKSSVPGNAYVAAAKRLVFGKVGIDMIAGPSEVLVIADDTGNADWIAADLLAQAEHDASAQSILITDSARLAADVEKAVEAQLKTLPRAAIASASWADFGAIIMVKNLNAAIPLADAIAAEHLEIMTQDPDALAAKIRNAGAVFLGAHTPEAIGDYVGGSNHVLPTARSARFFFGPLGARFPQAHFDPEMRPGSAACAGSGCDDSR